MVVVGLLKLELDEIRWIDDLGLHKTGLLQDIPMGGVQRERLDLGVLVEDQFFLFDSAFLQILLQLRPHLTCLVVTNQDLC